jgi:hypothetical protein
MIAPAGGIVNLHGVWSSGGWLGVRCVHCGHRGVLHKDKFDFIYEGNMTMLYKLRLRCQGCGLSGAGRDYWEMCTPHNEDEVDRFVRGYDIGRMAELHG